MDDDIFRNLTRQKGFGGEVILDMAIEKGSQEDAKKEKRKVRNVYQEIGTLRKWKEHNNTAIWA